MPVEADASVWRALLNACRLHSATNLAGTIFEKLVELEPINAGNYVLISNLYAAAGLWMEVRQIRTRLREKGLERPPGMQNEGLNPNSRTVVALLPACRELSELRSGQEIHGYALRNGLFDLDAHVGTALIGFYMRFDIKTTRLTFDSMVVRNIVSWNAIITGYVEIGEYLMALKLFVQMLVDGVKFDYVSMLVVIQARAGIGSIELGRQIYQMAIKNSYSDDLFIVNALLNVYKDGFRPNGATFVAVLSACRHSGLIEMGLQLFHTMVRDFKISPELVHYGCVVDLLGRAGRLDEGREFIESMPVEADASVWRALLNACQLHSATNLAGTIFEKLVELEPMNAGNYVLISNIYAAQQVCGWRLGK
ncbi:hypothetical protein ACE6H2_024326 [Prunus campanulata]